jgi:hypothetical protein
VNANFFVGWPVSITLGCGIVDDLSEKELDLAFVEF